MITFFSRKRKKRMSEQVLEQLYDEIVDVIHESFSSKRFFVKILQAKNGNVYLIVRKKRGRFVGEEKRDFQKKICEIVCVVFNFYCKENK